MTSVALMCTRQCCIVNTSRDAQIGSRFQSGPSCPRLYNNSMLGNLLALSMMRQLHPSGGFYREQLFEAIYFEVSSRRCALAGRSVALEPAASTGLDVYGLSGLGWGQSEALRLLGTARSCLSELDSAVCDSRAAR